MEVIIILTSIRHFIMDRLIIKLYQSPKTILNSRDISLIWQETNQNNFKSKISYYVRKNLLIRLTRGVFAKNKDYNLKELATSIYIPSYVSFETVLRESGVIFQHYNSIFVASKWSKTIKIDKSTFIFRKLKDIILFNSTGIINKNNYSIATPERAFLDMIYLFPNYYFDNLNSINWQECKKIVKIYNNKELVKRLDLYQKNYDK